MRTKDFQGVKIYRIPPEAKRTRKDGTPRDPKRLGKVHFPVFTADGRSVVGFMVSPPDVAGMIKQPDRFVGAMPFAYMKALSRWTTRRVPMMPPLPSV